MLWLALLFHGQHSAFNLNGLLFSAVFQIIRLYGFRFLEKAFIPLITLTIFQFGRRHLKDWRFWWADLLTISTRINSNLSKIQSKISKRHKNLSTDKKSSFVGEVFESQLHWIKRSKNVLWCQTSIRNLGIL
jgi:hypothetical protein